MKIDYPRPDEIPGLKALWQEAFGDSETFLEVFFRTGFRADRCLCVTEWGRVSAALYWFDCELEGRKLAYIYAVATAEASRGRGLCRELMEQTKKTLRDRGYAAAVLVPGDLGLFRMYEKMGYRRASGIDERVIPAGAAPETLHPATPEEYEARRRALLPPGGVVQDLESIRVLAISCRLYAGADYVLADAGDWFPEYLGDPVRLPGFVRALGKGRVAVRLPGRTRLFAMCLPLTEDAPSPQYFGLALD